MIGNDIVDLSVAQKQSNWLRKGFLNKIFTETEQDLILNNNNPHQLVWQLWSMKESAYKIYVQQHGKRFFAPNKFECTLENQTQGIVTLDTQKYTIQSKITDNYVYATASLQHQAKVESFCFKIEDTSASNQRTTTYRQLKKMVHKRCNIPILNLKIKKTQAGIPLLYHGNKRICFPFSLTHHGNYGAIAIDDNNLIRTSTGLV